MHYRRWWAHGDPMAKLRNYKDLVGRQFGHLTVVRLDRSDKSGTYWRVVCRCGKTSVVSSQHLRDGHTRSCGCRNGLTVEQVGLSRVRALYRRNARDRGHEWGLDDDDLATLIGQPCWYCGAPPANAINRPPSPPYRYSGIDRLDNAAGYMPENSVSCCRTCNMMKGALDVSTFMAAVDKIAAHRT